MLNVLNRHHVSLIYLIKVKNVTNKGKGEITIVLSKTADITHLTRLDYRHMCDIRSRMDRLSEC